MTAPRDYRDFFRDMVLACRSAIRFTDGMTLDEYLGDEKTRFAVMHRFEIVGEAVRHLPDALKAAHSEIPWATMAAVRNRIVHGYFGIDDSILFTTIEEDPRPLLPIMAKRFGMAHRELRVIQSDDDIELLDSLKAEAERLTQAEGCTLNQFINMAVAEKISALRAVDFLRFKLRRFSGAAIAGQCKGWL